MKLATHNSCTRPHKQLQCRGRTNGRTATYAPCVCSASAPTILDKETSTGRYEPPSSPIVGIVQGLFSFPPVFNAAATAARQKIMDRAGAVGCDFQATVQQLADAQDWEAALQEVTNPAVRYPDYYTKPFHAYPKGNLSLQAAFEVQPAAVSVHANVMDPAGKELNPKGDELLRGGYSRVLQELLLQLPHRAVHDIVDLGCATGLSTLELQRIFPCSSLTGVDLSPHFLTVARYQQKQREAAAGGPEPITFIHQPAEDTGLPDGCADLVSLSLVCHELPQQPTKAIFQEAYRLLRPGGVLTVMDMNPSAAMFKNPVAFAVFSSTEPHLKEYLTLDIQAAMQAAGFMQPLQGYNTPRHRTVVTIKPSIQ